MIHFVHSFCYDIMYVVQTYMYLGVYWESCWRRLPGVFAGLLYSYRFCFISLWAIARELYSYDGIHLEIITMFRSPNVFISVSVSRTSSMRFIDDISVTFKMIFQRNRRVNVIIINLSNWTFQISLFSWANFSLVFGESDWQDKKMNKSKLSYLVLLKRFSVENSTY